MAQIWEAFWKKQDLGLLKNSTGDSGEGKDIPGGGQSYRGESIKHIGLVMSVLGLPDTEGQRDIFQRKPSETSNLVWCCSPLGASRAPGT